MPYVVADDLPNEPAGVRFRRLLDRPQILQMPGAHLGIAALLAKRAGFETLRAAARARRHVTVGFVDKQGQGRTLTVLPLSVTAGQVDALDEAKDRVVRIALPRITKVVLA